MPLILPGNVASATAGGYEIANSVRMNDGDSPYFAKTPSAGDRAKWTFSVWFKIGISPTGSQNIFTCGAAANNTDQSTIKLEGGTIDWWEYDRSETDFDGRLTTNRLIRDPSAWYHLVCTWDTDNGTAGNRMRMYINGTEETSFSTDNNPSSGYDSAINSNELHEIGRASWNSAGYFDGYFAEMAFCDGQAYAASDFGEFDSDSPTIWKPKDISGLTFGSQGWYMDFEDSGDLDDDESGNGNDWTANNLAASDQMLDTPTNNFCVLNSVGEKASTCSLAEGNLKIGGSNVGWGIYAEGTFSTGTTGKFYWEFSQFDDTDNEYSGNLGIKSADRDYNYTEDYVKGTNDGGTYVGKGWYLNVGGGNPLDATSVDNDTNGDITMIAYDASSGKLWFGVNGTWEQGPVGSGSAGTGNPGSGTYPTADVDIGGANVPQDTDVTGDAGYTREQMPVCEPYHSGYIMNFGADGTFAGTKTAQGNADGNDYGNFYYAVPSGFFALCSKNLADQGG